jgi:hypothetical protein
MVFLGCGVWQLVDEIFEEVPALAVILEHIERGGSRGKEHCVPGTREALGGGHGFLEGVHTVAIGIFPGAGDAVSHLSDQHGGSGTTLDEFRNVIEFEALVFSPGNQNNRPSRRAESLSHGVQICRL